MQKGPTWMICQNDGMLSLIQNELKNTDSIHRYPIAPDTRRYQNKHADKKSELISSHGTNEMQTKENNLR